MPRVSRYDLPHREEQELSQNFSQLISLLHDSHKTEKFLDEFLTFEEKNMLSKRLALFMLLEQDFPASHIQAKLHLSKETVRVYQHQFPSKSTSFRSTISQLLRSQKITSVLRASGKTLHTIITSKSNMKSRSKLLSPHLR